MWIQPYTLCALTLVDPKLTLEFGLCSVLASDMKRFQFRSSWIHILYFREMRKVAKYVDVREEDDWHSTLAKKYLDWFSGDRTTAPWTARWSRRYNARTKSEWRCGSIPAEPT